MPERAAVGKNEVKSGGLRVAVRKAALLPYVFVKYASATGGPFEREVMLTARQGLPTHPN